VLRLLRDTAARTGTVGLAIVFALAFASFYVLSAVAQVIVSAAGQHLANGDGFTFHVAHTRVDLNEVVTTVIAFAFVALGLYAVWHSEAHGLRTCPDCLSEIPRNATVCRYCSTELGVEEG
jgi:large-conductance mechanosensitive channel